MNKILQLGFFLSKTKILFVLIALELIINVLMGFALKDIHIPANETSPVLDMKLYYDYNIVNEYFTTYTPTDRKAYFLMQMIDLFYPLVYGSLILALLFRFYREKKKILLIMPVLAVVFDYFENILLIYTNLHYPAVNKEIIFVASIFTLIKWIFIIFSLIFILKAISSYALQKFLMI